MGTGACLGPGEMALAEEGGRAPGSDTPAHSPEVHARTRGRNSKAGKADGRARPELLLLFGGKTDNITNTQAQLCHTTNTLTSN